MHLFEGSRPHSPIALPIAKRLRLRAGDWEHHVLAWSADEVDARATEIAGSIPVGDELVTNATVAGTTGLDAPAIASERDAGSSAFHGRNGKRATVVLVHGFMDAAGSWERVAERLAMHGFSVFAPDMRGFGSAPRVGAGGYYHFADYVADLADVVERLSPSEPVILVGHSMGGTIATLFAGAFPERVVGLVNLEGLGPPDNTFEVAPARMRTWIDGVRALRERGSGRSSFSRAEALRRLAMTHPNVDRAILEERLVHLVVDVPEAGPDRVAWRFDPLHRTTSPMPFFAAQFATFSARVTCPVLFVSGGPTGFHPTDEDERLSAFPSLRRVEIGTAGHMMHWTEPGIVADHLVTFFDGLPGVKAG